MRDEMLFIDGELVDLDDNTKITLNIKSNLFTDLSKIVSNNSYTIKLPKTVRNQRIIQHADLPACNTDYPRKFHQGRYFRNGVEIVPNAKVALISVSDSIEMAMAWGNIIVLQGIVENDKSLNELIDHDYHIIWEKGVISDYDIDSPFIMSKINMGIRNYDTVNYVHPSVRATWILERISEDNGLFFSFTEKTQAFINKLIVPLLERHGREFDVNKQFALRLSYNNGERHGYYLTALINEYRKDEYTEVVENLKNGYAAIKILQPHTKIQVAGLFFFDCISEIPISPAFVMYTLVDDVPQEVLAVDAADISLKGGDTYTVSFDFSEVTVELNTGDIVYFAFRDTGFFTNNWGMDTFSLGFIPAIELATLKGYNGSDGYYPIISNLPDIKQIDFLKAIAYMTGTFACVAGNKLMFVSMDDLISNRKKALDWTQKVVAEYMDNKPMSMKYTLDGFAQNNYYHWKEDEKVKGSYDSSLFVDNLTLEYEKDVVTMPFAATDTLVGDAYIPLYTYNDSEEGTLESAEPRILTESDNGGKSKATFQGMSWGSLISKFYTNYQNVIRKPIIITEKIEIGDVELRDIDVTVPVYLAQYGRYYAIISIKAENTGICECELLQLEV